MANSCLQFGQVIVFWLGIVFVRRPQVKEHRLALKQEPHRVAARKMYNQTPHVKAKKAFEKLSAAGVGTIVGMHISDDHRKEYEILINELNEYNPELLHKKIVIGISKSEMLDDELKQEIAKVLPDNIPHVFVSSLASQGLVQLKDELWRALTATDHTQQ